MNFRIVASTVALVGLGLTAPALAQTNAQGFSLNRFNPADHGSDWFSLDSLDLRGNGRFSLGVVGDYARKPLVIYDADGKELQSPVSDQFYLHLGGTIILQDRFRVSANLPVLLVNEGKSGSLQDEVFSTKQGFAVGDLRLGGDVRLVGTYDDAFTLSAGVQVHLPTGNRDAFASDGKVRLVPRVQAAGTAGAFAYGLRVAFDGRFLQDNFGNQPFGHEVVFGASAGIRFADGRGLIGPEFYGSTVVSDSAAFKSKATPMEAILGAHMRVSDSVRIGVGGGPGLTRALGSPQYRLLASLAYFPAYKHAPPADFDKDGIIDSDDACPADPGPERADPKTNGCPDTDGDNIIDKQDACPREPGEPNADPKKHGCPPPKDTDGDGILDPVDACPLEAGEPNEDPKKHGCPLPPDSDGDGIVDPVDACRLEPGVPSEDPKKHGCPPDRDGDTIIDPVDACPDVPGDPDKDPKKNGCPKVKVEGKEIKIFERIEFDYNKATIRPESLGVLNAVLRALKEHPEIAKLRVEGHTDSRGAAGYNKRLSQARAESVVQWFVEQGLQADRFVAMGYGKDKPIETNKTEAGRQLNRRVQFIILENKGDVQVETK
ncbi:MAG: OmpA family protein [Deltaproteobacteria bacterium]|nr:OmpA family protein [Deltaproteobacteria bacterium]